MNEQTLSNKVTDAHLRSFSTLLQKNNKYNPGHDKLAHFKTDTDSISEQVSEAISNAKKHWTKIRTMSGRPDIYDMNEWTESLDDMVNYMRLIECLLVDSGKILREGTF